MCVNLGYWTVCPGDLPIITTVRHIAPGITKTNHWNIIFAIVNMNPQIGNNIHHIPPDIHQHFISLSLRIQRNEEKFMTFQTLYYMKNCRIQPNTRVFEKCCYGIAATSAWKRGKLVWMLSVEKANYVRNIQSKSYMDTEEKERSTIFHLRNHKMNCWEKKIIRRIQDWTTTINSDSFPFRWVLDGFNSFVWLKLLP